mgnify:CR=1 FL=1|tara:strand:+ start:187 stop:609 length:423 start_codon:yes stop_codon:yes gene_type:complete
MNPNNQIQTIAEAIKNSQTLGLAAHTDHVNEQTDQYKETAKEVNDSFKQAAENKIAETMAYIAEQKALQESFRKQFKEEIVQLMDGSHGKDGFAQLVTEMNSAESNFKDYIKAEKEIIQSAMEKIAKEIGTDYSFGDGQK